MIFYIDIIEWRMISSQVQRSSVLSDNQNWFKIRIVRYLSRSEVQYPSNFWKTVEKSSFSIFLFNCFPHKLNFFLNRFSSPLFMNKNFTYSGGWSILPNFIDKILWFRDNLVAFFPTQLEHLCSCWCRN